MGLRGACVKNLIIIYSENAIIQTKSIYSCLYLGGCPLKFRFRHCSYMIARLHERIFLELWKSVIKACRFQIRQSICSQRKPWLWFFCVWVRLLTVEWRSDSGLQQLCIKWIHACYVSASRNHSGIPTAYYNRSLNQRIWKLAETGGNCWVVRQKWLPKCPKAKCAKIFQEGAAATVSEAARIKFDTAFSQDDC